MRTKVISAILGSALSLAIATPILAHKPAAREYPTLLQVTAVQGLGHDDASDMQEGYYVYLRNQHGHTYRVHTDSGDYNIDEYYSCIMSDNSTPEIMDDIVIDYKYERPDLFEDIYNH